MTSSSVAAPQFQHCFDLHVHVGPTRRIGHGDGELLEFTPVLGGSISGPRLSGLVLAGGGDWSTTRRQVAELEARYLLQASDGTVIDIVNRGYWRERDGYFRTAPVFRTDAPEHRWLTEQVFVATAHDVSEDEILIRVFGLD